MIHQRVLEYTTDQYQAIGKVAANSEKHTVEHLFEVYKLKFQTAISRSPTRKHWIKYISEQQLFEPYPKN